MTTNIDHSSYDPLNSLHTNFGQFSCINSPNTINGHVFRSLCIIVN